MEIRTTPSSAAVSDERLAEILANPGFGNHFTDHMLLVEWTPDAGWHDAGNFDMYVPSTAPTAQSLLLAYEWAPTAFTDKQLDIPESGNGTPDILDEAKWGLVWVLSMQEPGGAFRHREAVMESSPELPADKDRSVRWVAGPSHT